MARESLAEKLAKKSFNSPDVQKSWQVHMQAFGPILESAFVDNYQCRVHLTAALNQISRQDINGGLKKLQSLQGKCENAGDKAALLFCMGVGFEMAGYQDQMMECYTYANEYGHRFYLPYMKVAKVHLSEHNYDAAEENFRAAIGCFDATGLDEGSRLILGSAYANLGSCLTMMHRYDEAENALSNSRALYPDAPGRAVSEVVLFAVRGDKEQVEHCLVQIKEHAPGVYDDVKSRAERILNHTDPLFYALDVDGEKIDGFWEWFTRYSPELLTLLERREFEAALMPVADHILEVFPFIEERPYIALGQNDSGYVLELKDMYAVAVVDAYEKLLQACPEAILSQWQFSVVH